MSFIYLQSSSILSLSVWNFRFGIREFEYRPLSSYCFPPENRSVRVWVCVCVWEREVGTGWRLSSWLHCQDEQSLFEKLIENSKLLLLVSGAPFKCQSSSQCMTIVVISPGNTLIQASTHPKSPPPRVHWGLWESQILWNLRLLFEVLS